MESKLAYLRRAFGEGQASDGPDGADLPVGPDARQRGPTKFMCRKRARKEQGAFHGQPNKIRRYSRLKICATFCRRFGVLQT